MTIRVRREGRRGVAIIWLVALALGLLWVQSVPVFAAPGSFTDPDDVPLRLDLMTISHTDDAQSITYILETYESYPDEHADFLWSLDQNGDGTADWYVEIVWEGQLIASVNDGAENQVADGSVSRPAPNAIQVSFPASVLQGATTYNYSVVAQTDVNNDGEPDPGESDLAPDTGSYEHLLGPGAPQSSTTPARRPTASPTPRGAAQTPRPAASPAPRPAPGPARPAASPALQPAGSLTPQPAASPAPQPAASPGPARAPAAAPARAPAAAVPRPVAQTHVAAPAAPQPTTLAKTGSRTIAISVTGGLLLTLGGLFVAMGSRRPRAARS